MGSKRAKDVRLETLRQVEARVAAREPVDLRLLAAIRALLTAAEAERDT